MGEIDPLARLSRAAIIERLVAEGVRAETAVFYVDAYLEYREASKNIDEHGAMVLHPRTANPIENPYLKVRDRAFLRLRKVSRSLAPGKVAWLW